MRPRTQSRVIPEGMGAVELEVVDVFQVGWNDVVCSVNQGLIQID